MGAKIGNTNGFKRGQMPWNKGKRGVMVAWNKGRNIQTNTGKTHFKKGNKGIWLNKERFNMRGEKHFNWKGGISRDKNSQSNPQCKKWRSDVFQRDNWTCQTCGLRGVYLEAHHIKGWASYPELRFDIENGVALCRDCHKLTDNYKGKANKK